MALSKKPIDHFGLVKSTLPLSMKLLEARFAVRVLALLAIPRRYFLLTSALASNTRKRLLRLLIVVDDRAYDEMR